MDFWRILAILDRRKWWLALSGLVAAVLAFGVSRLVGASWMATVRFVAPQNVTVQSSVITQNGQAQQPQPQDNGTPQEIAKAQVGVFDTVVKSREVVEPVLQNLGQTAIAADVMKNVDFVATGPRLYELNVTDANPTRAERLANGLADRFLAVYHQIQTDQARKVVTVLDEQQRLADRRLAVARRKYDEYRGTHDIVGNLDQKLQMVMDHLKNVRDQRDLAAAKVAAADSAVSAAQANLAALPPLVASTSPIDNPVLKSLRQDLAAKEVQLSELRVRYTDEMPVVKKAIADRDALQARLQQEERRKPILTMQANPAIPDARKLLDDSRTTRASALAELAQLDSELGSSQAELQSYKGVDSPLTTLASDLAEMQDARASLTQRLNAAKMALDESERQSPLTIVDRVQAFNPPINTTAGRTVKFMVLAVICTMLLAAVGAVSLDSVDRRVRTPQEAATALPAPVLAAIPQPMGAVTYSTLARATELYPHSLHSESYRFLGLHMLTHQAEFGKSLMVASAKAEQGSTTTLTNLAITLAQAGHKVVVVDANTRTAELHQVFDVDNSVGFTDLLSDPDNVSLDDVLHKTDIPNLWVIPSGPAPKNPWVLFHSGNLTRISDALKARMDYVLYDTPSSNLFTDAVSLAPVVDTAFFCVRAMEPVTGAEERVLKMLNDAGIHVAGCVLNEVPAHVIEGYDNYRHYYANPSQPHMALPPARGPRETAEFEVIGPEQVASD